MADYPQITQMDADFEKWNEQVLVFNLRESAQSAEKGV